jgi:uncharacterized protein (TIGR03435 family)
MSLKRLITTAFGIKSVQVIGPDWLDTPRFEIRATVPDDTTKDQLSTMWQKLLSDRFHLAAHHETRETTVFDLMVSKTGPKLTPAGQTARLLAPPPMGTVVRGHHIYIPRTTMEKFAGFLSGQVDHVVRDATGLTGEYAIRFAWGDFDAAPDLNSAPPLPDALQEQLGLRLEAKKAPVDMLVIDHMDRKSTEN